MSRADTPGNVFTYDDYRAFLRDSYTDRKQRGLSYRGLARRAGLSSPSFLKAVIDGQKNLAPETSKRVAAALSLVGDAAEYFRWLVVLTQTTDPVERRSIQAHLGRLRRYQDVQALAEASDAYHRRWYLPAIRELSLTRGFLAEPTWIAKVLRPKILVREAKQALATLEQLGLLRPDSTGTLRAVHQQVDTQLEPNSDQIASYHRTMIALATQALSSIPRTERDISSITLAVDVKGMPALKRRIQEIRRELLDEFDAGSLGVQVVQVNFQLFPLSERIDARTENT